MISLDAVNIQPRPEFLTEVGKAVSHILQLINQEHDRDGNSMETRWWLELLRQSLRSTEMLLAAAQQGAIRGEVIDELATRAASYADLLDNESALFTHE